MQDNTQLWIVLQGKRINLYYYLPTYLLFRSSKQARVYPTTLTDQFEQYHLEKHVLPDATFDDWQARMRTIRTAPLREQAGLQAAFDIVVQQYIYDSRP